MHFSSLNISGKYILLLLFVLGSSFMLNAQKIYIAEDFVNCGIGLKDSSGNWVVQPVYTHIYRYSGDYFTVLLGSDRGVINNQGKTIVPVIYDEIETNYSGAYTGFIVTKDKKQGFYDTSGKIIVPVKFKYIIPYQCGKIGASNNYKKWIFYNKDGSVTEIPFRMNAAPGETTDSLFIIRKNYMGLNWWRMPKRYGLMNGAGEMLIPRKYESVDCSHEKYNLIRLGSKNKVSYVNRQMQTIFEGESDAYYTSSVTRYSWERRSSSAALTINEYGYVPLKVNGKWGIMSATGDTILPFEYDAIEGSYFYESSGLSEGSYYISKKNQTGIYDASKKSWVMKPLYSELDIAVKYNNEKDSSELILFFAKSGNKYGIISSAGNEILPFVYEYYRFSPAGNWIFYAGDSSITVGFPELNNNGNYRSRARNINRIVNIIPGDNQFTVKKLDDGSLVYYNPSLVHDSLQLSFYKMKDERAHLNPENFDSLMHATAIVIRPLNKFLSFKSGGVIYSVSPNDMWLTSMNDTSLYYSPDGQINPKIYSAKYLARDKNYRYYSYNCDNRYKSYNYRSGLIRNDGKELVRRGTVVNIQAEDEWNLVQLFSVRGSKYKKAGIIDGNGNWLVDTTWKEIESTEENLALVVRYTGFLKLKRKENVLDMNTGQLLLTAKQEPYNIYGLSANSFVCSSASGPIVYNIAKRKFVTDPKFKMLLPLDYDGKYYAVKTCNANIGLMDSEGKLVLDTVWKTITYANYSFRKSTDYNQFVFYTDTSHIVFDVLAGRIVPENEWRNPLLIAATRNVSVTSKNVVEIRNRACPSLLLDSAMKLNAIQPWAQEVLTDSLFHLTRFLPDTNYYRKGNTCLYCPKETYFLYTWAKDYDIGTHSWIINSATDSCLSVYRCPVNYGPKTDALFASVFFTTLLYPDGPHPVLLDSLFTGTEWKNLITEEVLNYLNETPGVTGKCSNPYMFPVILRQRFQITEAGLVLYPPDYFLKNKQVKIVLPWEKLKPYLREDVKGKIGVK